MNGSLFLELENHQFFYDPQAKIHDVVKSMWDSAGCMRGLWLCLRNERTFWFQKNSAVMKRQSNRNLTVQNSA